MRQHHFVGVLGWPLEHTLSPVIHNAAFRAVGLDWVYLAWPVHPESLGDAVGGLRALGAMGANVTMPHKVAIIEHLDGLSGDARSIGAVNTVQRVGDLLVGHNTDVDGFGDFLANDAGFAVEGREALVLGAGGAARAVAWSLLRAGASRIGIAARDVSSASAVMGLVGESGSVVEWSSAASACAEFDLVVNATPVGMHGEDLLPEARFRPGQCVVDLVYAAAPTPVVERGRAHGADAWGGLGILVCQAAAAFRIWTSQDPPVEVMSAAAVRAIGSPRI